ncbi:MAG: hypothetical protein IT425_09045 [Pirellulales bacterium]|nr:hypothetical protein [Pirellulales bacterium]
MMSIRGWVCIRTFPARAMALSLLVMAVVAGNLRAATFLVGHAETIYTKSQRSNAGGSIWPDGSIGAVANSNGTIDFYAANSSKSVKTTGTLSNLSLGKKSSVSIKNVPKSKYNYLAGGPVFEDPYSGARLMIYHAEVHQGSSKNFYSVLGMAISTDAAGTEFRDLGEIIRPNLSSGFAEVGGGSFAVVDGFMNVYYRDWLQGGATSEVAVARAPMLDLITNALAGRGTSFTKYHNGTWSQPGISGLSSPLQIGNPWNSWLSVSYNDYLKQVVMVNSHGYPTEDLYITTSSDGVNWGPRQAIALDSGEQLYPSIVGMEANPAQSGQSFYVYYTDSQKGGWNRWNDAQLRRRSITVDPQQPLAMGQLSGNLGYSAEWTTVGDFQDDFQPGGPAAGWRYAWNPKGKKGKSIDYASLVWSDIAQGYNTTGAETTSPNPKSHHDDYLFLSSEGGHTGNKKYMPMAGYTIQADDGAGLYRLIDSSIQKGNGTLATKEDGLEVLVYVNDTLIGNGQQVSTSGSLANFDRTLGLLNVGDTIWVMINPLKNQIEDSFTSFDFSLQRLVYGAQSAMLALGTGLSQAAAVPEPGVAALVVMLLCGCSTRRRWCR